MLALAAAGSLGLHVAVLALPLGTAGGEESFMGARAAPLSARLHVPAGDTRRGAQAEVRASEPAPAAPPAPGEPAPAEEPLEAPAQAEIREPTQQAALPPVEALAPSSGVIPLSDEYFDAKKLTEPPRPLTNPPLAELERLIRHAGEVRMMLFIDESGTVTAVDVQSATLAQDAVARAAAIFSELRFSPGRIGAMAVKSRVGITVGAVAQNSYRN